MEHIPVRLHELSKEKRIVSHRRNMNGVGGRITRVIIIRSSHDRSLFGAVETVGVVAHTSNASIVRKVTSNRSFKSLMVATSKCNPATMTSTEGLNNVLHINLHAVNTAGSQVGMELVIKIKDFLWMHKANAMNSQAVYNYVWLVAQHTRRLDRVRQSRIIMLHAWTCWFHSTPITSQSMPCIHKSALYMG